MLSKETLENLSKYKYVYKAYISDDTIHFEKFPIVYANQNYIYYKQARKDELGIIFINSCYRHNDIYNNINDLIDTIKNNYVVYYNYFLISQSKKKQSDIDIKQINEKRKKRKKEKIEREIKYQKEEIERKKKELKKLQNELKDTGGIIC